MKKYIPYAKDLAKPERNTLIVDFADVEKHDDHLKNAIHEQLYCLHPFLCNSVKNFVKDKQNNLRSEQSQQQISANKEFYIAFENFSQTCKYIINLIPKINARMPKILIILRVFKNLQD